MEVRITASLSAEEFSQRFLEFWKNTTFRLELLDFYVAANEREPFQRFQSGEPQDLSWRRPWRNLVTGARQAGRTMQRVHVVSEPLTPYIEFELTCAYPTSATAGEDIRILPRGATAVLDLPTHDFWLFDSCLVALLDYDEYGNFVSVELVEDLEIARRHCRWRDVALQHAQPLQEYLDSRGLIGLVAANAT